MTVYADVEEPFTVSEAEAKRYYAKSAQPRWIRNRTSHPAHRLNGDWPCVEEEWPLASTAGRFAKGPAGSEDDNSDYADSSISEMKPPRTPGSAHLRTILRPMGSVRWSGLSLRFVLKSSRMGQFAVAANVGTTPLAPEAVEKLAKAAHAGMTASSQSSVAAQARTAAALQARMMEGDGDKTARLQAMMGLSAADLIAEGAVLDDPIVAAILGGDPAEYGMGHRAVSPEVIELD